MADHGVSHSDEFTVLDDIIAEFEQRLDAAPPTSAQDVEERRAALLRAHPTAAEKIRRYFADRDAVKGAIDIPADPTAEFPRLAQGTRVGDYEILEAIAAGGMGEVYKARQLSARRIVALKLLKPELAAVARQRERFAKEAQTMAELDHPHIVKVFEVHHQEGQPYFSMEYLPGGNLAARIERGAVPPREAALATMKIARAVQAAHERFILHRDLKPGNVLLDDHGEPKVTDFGLAKHLDAPSELTQTGHEPGTTRYMSPEQIRGDRAAISTRSDVWALGAILFELLTGKAPFSGQSEQELRTAILEGSPGLLRGSRRSLPRDLTAICLKCLEKEPQHRIATAQELANHLQDYLDGKPSGIRPTGVVQRAWRWSRRQPALAALGAALCCVVLTSVMGLGIKNEQLRRANVDTQTALIQVTTKGNAALEAVARANAEQKKAEDQKQEADRQRREAEKKLRVANAHRAIAAGLASFPTNPNFGLLATAEGVERLLKEGEPISPSTHQAMRDMMGRFSGQAIDGHTHATFDSSGRWMVTYCGPATAYAPEGSHWVTRRPPLLFDLSRDEPFTQGVELPGLPLYFRPLEIRFHGRVLVATPEKRGYPHKDNLYLWKRVGEQYPIALRAPLSDEVDTLQVSPDENWVVSWKTTLRGIAYLWRVGEVNDINRPVAYWTTPSLRREITGGTFSPDSKSLILTTWMGVARIREGSDSCGRIWLGDLSALDEATRTGTLPLFPLELPDSRPVADFKQGVLPEFHKAKPVTAREEVSHEYHLEDSGMNLSCRFSPDGKWLIISRRGVRSSLFGSFAFSGGTGNFAVVDVSLGPQGQAYEPFDLESLHTLFKWNSPAPTTLAKLANRHGLYVSRDGSALLDARNMKGPIAYDLGRPDPFAQPLKVIPAEERRELNSSQVDKLRAAEKELPALREFHFWLLSQGHPTRTRKGDRFDAPPEKDAPYEIPKKWIAGGRRLSRSGRQFLVNGHLFGAEARSDLEAIDSEKWLSDSLDFSPDDHSLAVIGDKGSVLLSTKTRHSRTPLCLFRHSFPSAQQRTRATRGDGAFEFSLEAFVAGQLIPYRAEFTPDNRHLLSFSPRQIRAWRLAVEKETRLPRPENEDRRSAAFGYKTDSSSVLSSDGKWLITVSESRVPGRFGPEGYSFHGWDLSQDRFNTPSWSFSMHMSVLDPQYGKMEEVTVGPQGRWFSFHCGAGWYWLVDRLEKVKPINVGKSAWGKKRFPRETHFSPDGRWAVITNHDDMAIYDLSARDVAASATAFSERFHNFSNNGQYIATSGGVYRLTSSTAGVVALQRINNVPELTDARWDPVAGGFIVISENRSDEDRHTSINFLHVHEGKLTCSRAVIIVFPEHSSPSIRSETLVSPDGKWFVVTLRNKLYAFDLTQGDRQELAHARELANHRFLHLRFSDNGRWLIANNDASASTEDFANVVCLWDMTQLKATTAPVTIKAGPTETGRVFAFGGDNQWLIALESDCGKCRFPAAPRLWSLRLDRLTRYARSLVGRELLSQELQQIGLDP